MKEMMNKPRPLVAGTLKPPSKNHADCPDCACAHCEAAYSQAAAQKLASQFSPNDESGKTTLFLYGLACADCAEKIRRKVSHLPGVSAAHLDFVGQKLVISGAAEQMPAIIVQIKKIVASIEPHVKVTQEKAKEQDKPEIGKSRIILFAAGIALLALAFFLPLPFVPKLALYIASYLCIGGRVLIRAGRNIAKGQIFDENFLMCVATVSAFGLGEFVEGVSVMLFYQIGEFFQDAAVSHSRRSIENLMDIRPDYANIESDGTLIRINPEEVHQGDTIVVKPGEKIPLDGLVLSGSSSLDTSSLTGETMPRLVQEGSEVLSGSVNLSALLSIQVSKEFGESTVSKILDLVQNAGSKKSKTEKFITKFARVYTPVVVFSAIALALLPPLLIPGATFADWISRALIFLIVSCPCALVLSIPLSFFGGIGAASKKGVLIKGGEYLEALNGVDTFVFDKTGTLTYGEFSVAFMQSEPAFTDEQLLQYAAAAESYSSHPIAVSIQKAYGGQVEQSRISGYREIAGLGISCELDGVQVFAGNQSLLLQNGIPCPKSEAPGTAIYVAAGGKYVGFINISDQVRKDSPKAITSLRALGIKKLVMLTGDNKNTAQAIANQLGLDEAYAELLPHQKVEKLEEISKKSVGKTAFVGDGINDAPVLARADVGIALGGLGSDAAIEAADIVLMTDEPGKLADAIAVARKTRINVMQNIIIALSVKGILLAMSAFGLANMWEAIFGDVGVAIIAVFNSMRLLHMPSKGLNE
jgi:Zn2+/Cd2+-exporting ATPase